MQQKVVWAELIFILDNGEVLARSEEVDTEEAICRFIIEFREKRYKLGRESPDSWVFVLREEDSTTIGTIYSEDASKRPWLLQPLCAKLPDELPLEVKVFIIFLVWRALEDYLAQGRRYYL